MRKKCYKGGQYSKFNNIEKAKLILLKQTILKKLVGKKATHFMYMERKQALISQMCPVQQIYEEMYEQRTPDIKAIYNY